MTTMAPAGEMIRSAEDLRDALDVLRTPFPEVHDTITAGLCETMGRDGVIEFRVLDLARRIRVPFGQLRHYLREGRALGLLALVGRRADGGHVRYCAYRAATPTAGAVR